jgi:hypothetical protein
MPHPLFWSPSLLQHDLQALGYVATPESILSSGAARAAAKAHLARIIDLAAPAPDCENSEKEADDFWEAFGLPRLDSADAAPAHAGTPRARRHAAAAAADMRASIDLAFAARALKHANHADTDDGIDCADDDDGERSTLISEFYNIFPRAVPVHTEPKFKPKMKRLATKSPPPEKNLDDREPLAVIRALSDANKAASAALSQCKSARKQSSFKKQRSPSPSLRGLPLCPPALSARALSDPEPAATAFASPCSEADITSPRAESELSEVAEIATRDAEAAHSRLLSFDPAACDPSAAFATPEDYDALASACASASDAAVAYSAMSADVLALASAALPRPHSDPEADALLAAHLPAACTAVAATCDAVENINRTRAAYALVAASAESAAITTRSAFERREALDKRAQHADQQSLFLKHSLAARASTCRGLKQAQNPHQR